ncbi:MAG: hypothetical protein PHH36_10110 [Sideroxydans sp.]|nr:hypothetical protein [Sideroxydans sp.]
MADADSISYQKYQSSHYVSERTKQRILSDMQAQGEVATRYTVLYLKDRKEHRTPWFKRRENANVALKLMRQKYGEKNAIIYVD